VARGTLPALPGDAAATASALGRPQLPAKKDWIRNSLGWTTKTVNARKPAPRRMRRWWRPESGELAPVRLNCLNKEEDDDLAKPIATGSD
jgi:hypothetical protein